MKETKIVKMTQSVFDVWIGKNSVWYPSELMNNEDDIEIVRSKYRDYITENSLDLEELRGKTLGCLCSRLICTPSKCMFGGELLKLINK